MDSLFAWLDENHNGFIGSSKFYSIPLYLNRILFFRSYSCDQVVEDNLTCFIFLSWDYVFIHSSAAIIDSYFLKKEHDILIIVVDHYDV